MLYNPSTTSLTGGLRFTKILGGKKLLKKNIRSEFDIITLSNEGITKASAESLIAYLGISRKIFTEDILNISVKTLERKSDTDKMDKRTSSHIIEIARVVDHAYAVFESTDRVKSWLHYQNKALNNIRPIDLFYLPTGLNMVDDLLGRIEEGVYS